jgi:phosphonate transport system ATP-binding protein
MLREDSESSNSEMVAAVAIKDLSMQYGGLKALAPISLEITEGERVAFLGPSGGGKTTLLLLLAGQLEPTCGGIRLTGKELSQLRPGRELAHLVGMIHQQFDLVPNISALHNVLAGFLGEWGLFRSLISLVWPLDREAGIVALSRVGVADRADVRTNQLSGGEQQRVAIARLLIQNPDLILADEPVASLDPARAEEVLILLMSIVRESNKTLIASMHSVQLAREHFSRLIGLRDGEILFDLPSSEVSDAHLRELYKLEGLRSEHQSF